MSPRRPFTQLAPNRLELLAEEHLPLTLAQLFLNLGLDVFLGVEHADLPLHVHQHAPQPLLDAQRLKQYLPLAGGISIYPATRSANLPGSLTPARTC